jgi:hypothetical protein
VQGAGTDIWGNADGFQFVDRPVNGDAEIVARITSLQNTSTFAKAGVMFRESLDPGAADVVLDLRPNGGVEFMSRSASGSTTTFIAGGVQAAPAWLKLTLNGRTVTASVSANGTAWSIVGSTQAPFGATALAGLVVCSHDTTTLNTATFDNVSVIASGSSLPAASNIVIYASDIPDGAIHGAWARGADSLSPAGVKLATPDVGVANTSAPLASPADYVDVPPRHLEFRMRSGSGCER